MGEQISAQQEARERRLRYLTDHAMGAFGLDERGARNVAHIALAEQDAQAERERHEKLTAAMVDIRHLAHATTPDTSKDEFAQMILGLTRSVAERTRALHPGDPE